MFQKNETFLLELSVHVCTWARKHRHKYITLFLLCCPTIFGSLAPSPKLQLPPPKLGASCVCETQAAAPSGEDTPQLPASLQRKLPLCVQASPPGQKRRTAWKNSKMPAIVCLVSHKIKSIFLHQMRVIAFRWFGGGVSVPALKLESWQVFQNYVFMDRRTLWERNTMAGDLISIEFEFL